MKILGIDHVALCAPDNDAAARPFVELLAMALGPREYIATQQTEALFVLTADEAGACVELIAPRGNAGLEKFIEQRGGRGGLHHIAFRVESVNEALTELDEKGVPLIDKTSRLGARGHQVGFIHPRAFGGVLVELVGG